VTEIKLRDYQRDAIDAVFEAWAGGMQRPAIVLPTGAGKTVVFSALVKEFRSRLADLRHLSIAAQRDTGLVDGAVNPVGKRVMILAHRDELVDQAMAKVRAVMPGVNVGKVKASVNEITADVIVASVQTLASQKRRNDLLLLTRTHGDIGLIITDECHHATAATYQKIYAAFPDALQLGVTATMARGDQQGLGDQWQDVVYKRSILWMISKKYLTDVRTKRIDLESLSMAGVKVGMGDWQAGALGDALMESKFDSVIADAYREHAGARQGIVFTPTVETAWAACDAMDRVGIPSEVVSGETPREERQILYERFRTGRTRVLINCMVLTEGFDMPQAEVAVIARPTRSAPLYAQMVGRVLRPYPGKTEALVLDLVGASANKLCTLIDLEPGAVEEVGDGESLAEAVVREAEAQEKKVPAGSLAFELKVREVSSFASSEHAWQRTPKGVLFINCGAVRVFLWPSAEPGTWDVCTHTRDNGWQRTERLGLDLGSAMAWGEATAEDYAEFSVARSARWRKDQPSQGQLDYAVALGIEGADRMRRGELSEAIDLRLSADIFDPYVRG